MIRAEIDRLMPEGQLATALKADRTKAEWDWYFALSPADQARVRRHSKPGGEQPDQCARSAGYDYVDQWAQDLAAAILGDDTAKDDGWDHQRRLEAAEALVGPAEVAAMRGVAVATIRQWVRRGLLPAPFATVSGIRIWTRADIEDWALETGRNGNETDSF